MTTLPTTSTYRLPRTPGGGPNVPPTQPPGGPGGPTMPNPGLTPADVWRVLRGNLWLIVATIAVAVAAGIGLYSYLLKNNPKYRSTGLLLIDRPYRPNPSATVMNDSSAPDFVLAIEQRTQQQQLMSEILWVDVLTNNEMVRGTDWFKNLQAQAQRNATDAVKLAKADLDDNLRATPITDSKLVQLSMDAAKPEDARIIVQAIGDAHISNQQKRSFDRTSQELTSAKQWQAGYVTKRKEIKNLMNAQLNRGGMDTGRQTIKEMQMSQLVAQLTKARMEASEAQGQLEALNNQISQGKDPYQVSKLVKMDDNIRRLQMMVDQYEFEVNAQITAGDNSPQAKGKQANLAAARAKLDKATASNTAEARAEVIDMARSSAAAAKAEADALESQIEDLRGQLTEANAARAEALSLKDELDNYALLEREMGERVAVLQNAVRQQTASVAWYGNPTMPDTLQSPNLKVILPIAVMAGLALSLGIAFMRELADTSVRSPRDITRVGPMNVLGMVADESDDTELSGVPLHTVINTAPNSLIAEQLRQVRTRLQHAASLDTTRTILVTSPGPEDGKTTIACNLAAGLALNGRRILLVDANFHRPALNKLFNVANDVGFSNVLESVGNLDSAVKKTPVANLEVLTTGPRPGNPTELLESPLLSDFTERALEEYDHIIFDGGPLLVVSEAVALAPRVDGVVTVLRAKKNTRGMLGRVRDTLKQIKAEQLGVVLNGVQTWGGGYYARNIKTYYDYQSQR